MNSDKILNPETGRYVLKTGKIGKKLLEQTKKVAEPKAKKVAEPTAKEMNINDLKNEWNSTYKTTKQSLSFNINSDKDNFLDIELDMNDSYNNIKVQKKDKHQRKKRQELSKSASRGLNSNAIKIVLDFN